MAEPWTCTPSMHPGGTIKISGQQQNGNFVARFRGISIPIFRTKTQLVGWVPIPIDTKYGNGTIQIYRTAQTSKLVTQKSIRIIPWNYRKFFYYAKTMESIQRHRAVARVEWREMEPVLTHITPTRYFSGSFLLPVNNIVTQPFGAANFVNGKPGTRHSGTDLRARMGTPVHAAQSGIVRITKRFTAFGGTVVIDHGWGIYSVYFHLSKFLVQNGKVVRRGQVIARSGNTGYSTGPHLHWSMSLYNVRVDPLQWLSARMAM